MKLFIYLFIHSFIHSYNIHYSRTKIGNDSESRILDVCPVYVPVSSRCLSCLCFSIFPVSVWFMFQYLPVSVRFMFQHLPGVCPVYVSVPSRCLSGLCSSTFPVSVRRDTPNTRHPAVLFADNSANIRNV
jgi:hypothetical protein